MKYASLKYVQKFYLDWHEREADMQHEKKLLCVICTMLVVIQMNNNGLNELRLSGLGGDYMFSENTILAVLSRGITFIRWRGGFLVTANREKMKGRIKNLEPK